MNIATTAPVVTPTLPITVPNRPNPYTAVGTVKIGFGRDTTAYQERPLLVNYSQPALGSIVSDSALEAATAARQLLRSISSEPLAKTAVALLREGRSRIISFRTVNTDELLRRGIAGQAGIHSFEFLNGTHNLVGLVTADGMRFAPRSLQPMPSPMRTTQG